MDNLSGSRKLSHVTSSPVVNRLAGLAPLSLLILENDRLFGGLVSKKLLIMLPVPACASRFFVGKSTAAELSRYQESRSSEVASRAVFVKSTAKTLTIDVSQEKIDYFILEGTDELVEGEF